ncbi:hypothetical protein U9M48_020032 [Paspalum notatum var. saurae]|uniref:Uncharacterized protein n=1 Tax=Paspalum notatum var. saurae TaxID=547442 RepID=A0AAQ3TE94_PASNO
MRTVSPLHHIYRGSSPYYRAGLLISSSCCLQKIETQGRACRHLEDCTGEEDTYPYHLSDPL